MNRAFNPFLVTASLHRDMRLKMKSYISLMSAELEDNEFESVEALRREQLQYIAAVHNLLEAIDSFIAAEDEQDMLLLKEHAETVLSVTVDDMYKE